MELRLAIYCPWIHRTGGTERKLLELARRSRHRITIFTSHYQADATYPEFADLDVRVHGSLPGRSNPWSAAAAAVRIALRKLALRDFDALLVVSDGYGDLVVLRNRDLPIYNLCLTPMRPVFDDYYRAIDLAERGRLERRLIEVGSAVFRVVDRMVWRRYRRVFAVSEEVRLRILRGGLAPDARLRVVHPGVDLDRFHPSQGSPEADRTFFLPGRIAWPKHLELAIEAFQRFRRQHGSGERWKLQIAGMVDRKGERYLARLRALADGQPDIEFHVAPSDAEMDALYRRCACSLFTAFNDDSGLVLLEAMACGKPVVSVKRGGPLGIVSHNEDGLLVDPDPQSFSDAMLRMAQDPEMRERMGACAAISAGRFRWDAFVDRVDAELEADRARGARRLRGGRGPVLREWAI